LLVSGASDRAKSLASAAIAAVLILLTAAAPARADDGPIQAQPGQTVVVPLSDNAKVLVSTCGDGNPHLGPSGSAAQVYPDSDATIGSFDTSKTLVPPDGSVTLPPSVPASEVATTAGGVPVQVSPTAPVGLVIVFSWQTYSSGCYSANGVVAIDVVAGAATNGGGGSPGSGGSTGPCVSQAMVNWARAATCPSPTNTPGDCELLKAAAAFDPTFRAEQLPSPISASALPKLPRSSPPEWLR
jgi:hypothetical protein